MSIICVSGQPHEALQHLSKLLQGCGMKSPLPLQRDSTFDILKWHDRVAASMGRELVNASEADEGHAVTGRTWQASRIWEQLAVDLLLANLDSHCWGWAHEGAVELLDFWAQLESSIRFVLVCEDSTSLISRLIQSGQSAENISSALRDWQKRHHTMLRFHARNPAVSMLAWSTSVQASPDQLIQYMRGTWNVELDALAHEVADLGKPNSLMRQIAHQIQSEYPETVALDQEIKALIGPSACSSQQTPARTSDLISDYLVLLDRSKQVAQIEKLQHQLSSAEQALKAARQNFTTEQLNRQIQVKVKEAEAAAKTRTETKVKEAEAAANARAEAKVKDLQKECDLLLQQLHQVQQELENYYLKHQEQQHQVKQLQARWARAVGKHPALQDFESVEIIAESASDNTTRWRINQLKVQSRILGPFEFKTLIENGVAGFVFSKDAKGQSPLTRWPVIAAKSNEVTLIPSRGGDDPKRRTATLLQLSTTDWYMLKQLADTLSKALSAADVKPKLHKAEIWISALQAQNQFLDKVPALLRFDTVRLAGQQTTATKSVLALQLTQVDLKGLQTQHLDFQVQLNISADAAATSAHLIFGEKTSGAPFEAWTSNVNSSGGQPVMAVMLSSTGWDPGVWHKLSPQDRQWLQNIVILLPLIWGSLHQQNTRLEKGWAKWVEAAADMRTWSQQAVLPRLAQTAVKSKAPSKRLETTESVPKKKRAPRAAKKASAPKPKTASVKASTTSKAKSATKRVPQALPKPGLTKKISRLYKKTADVSASSRRRAA